MNVDVLTRSIALLTRCLLAIGILIASGINTQGQSSSTDQILELTDGSDLHGELKGLSESDGLQWKHPLSSNSVRFRLDHLSRLRLNPRTSVQNLIQPECRIEFANGDLIYGNLDFLGQERVALTTWFGGRLETDRSALKRIAFLMSGYKVLYEGPNDISEWEMGQGQNGWAYADGQLRIVNRGVLGRNFDLTDSCNLSFDLEWDQPYQLSVTLFTDTFNRFDYRQGSYIFFLSPQFVSFQRVQPGTGVLTLGQTRIENLSGRNQARFSIRAHRETAKFAVYIDDILAATFRDNRGFVAEGRGISLASQLSASSFSLSNMLVTEWDGTDESDLDLDQAPESDVLYLINHDKPKGDVVEIQDRKVHFKLRKERDIRIPMERIKQIQFNNEPSTEEAIPGTPRAIRAHFAGGGSLSFNLVSWNDDLLIGESQHFGDLQFKSAAIRQIEFNLKLQSQQYEQAADTYWNMDHRP